MRRITTFALAAAASCSGPGLYADVPYDDRFGDQTTMDIHVPDNAGSDRPAVMLIHGGAWRYGSKDAYSDAAERLARAGYVAATINYRLVPGGTYPAAVQDCVCALSFLRANAAAYGIDPDRIAVMGYSAGGHLSSLVGVAGDLGAHAPDCEWGPTGLPAAVIPGGTDHDMRRSGDNDLVTDFMGGSQEEIPELYQQASPIAHVREGLPPYLVIHGQDDVVDVDGAIAMVDALRAAGNDAALLELENAGHITSPTDTGQVLLQAVTDMPEAWAATIDFLDRALGAP
ncbi:MAG TPA: alpha/beta hydrolase [Kofleriaceae bacterium]|nr:alpha/beta hydrolase [Kofleriaceae bacterium]